MLQAMFFHSARSRPWFGFFLVVFLFQGISSLCSDELPSIAHWKDDRKMALSFTFDDGLANHVEVVAPLLEKHGHRGTFFSTQGKLDVGPRARNPPNPIGLYGRP